MTSIRTLIEAHSPIVAAQTSRPGIVGVEHADYAELLAIVGEPLEIYSQSNAHYFVNQNDFDEYVRKAHAKVHSEIQGAQKLRDLMNELPPVEAFDQIFGKDEDEKVEKVEKVERDEDGEQRRNVSIHYATQIIIAQTQASHGLEATPDDVVTLAGRISDFIKG